MKSVTLFYGSNSLNCLDTFTVMAKMWQLQTELNEKLFSIKIFRFSFSNVSISVVLGA